MVLISLQSMRMSCSKSKPWFGVAITLQALDMALRIRHFCFHRFTYIISKYEHSEGCNT